MFLVSKWCRISSIHSIVELNCYRWVLLKLSTMDLTTPGSDPELGPQSVPTQGFTEGLHIISSAGMPPLKKGEKNRCCTFGFPSRRFNTSKQLLFKPMFKPWLHQKLPWFHRDLVSTSPSNSCLDQANGGCQTRHVRRAQSDRLAELGDFSLGPLLPGLSARVKELRPELDEDGVAAQQHAGGLVGGFFLGS